MGKKKRNAKRVTKVADYLGLFPDDKPSETERRRSRVLKKALDIRKFEIDLYWKRTGFFWAFITVIYTALFAVLCKYVEHSCEYSIFVPVISTLAGLGFFFSVAWHMVNKGSKFWQENWEKHVSLLEKSEIGPLYDVFLNPKTTGSRWSPTKEFDFSVTKVNMWASTLISVISFFGFVGMNLWLIFKQKEVWYLVLLPSFFVLLFIFCLICKSNGNNDIEIEEENFDELNMIHIK